MKSGMKLKEGRFNLQECKEYTCLKVQEEASGENELVQEKEKER